MPKKGEKLTEAQLEALARARQRALEVRQEKAQLKRDEKELSQLEKEEKKQTVKKRLASIKQPEPEPEPEETEEVEEIVEKPVRRKGVLKKAPAKKKVVYVEESSESEEEQPVVIKRKPKVKTHVISDEDRQRIIAEHQEELDRQEYLAQAEAIKQQQQRQPRLRTNLFGPF